MAAALTARLGAPVDVRYDLTKGHITVTRIEPEPDQDPATMRQLRQVFADVAGADITETGHDTDGRLTAFTVTYNPTSADTDPAWRAKLDGIVCAKTAHPWVAEWTPSAHRADYKEHGRNCRR